MTEKINTSHEAVEKTGRVFLIGFGMIALLLFFRNSHSSDGWNFHHGINTMAWRWFLGASIMLFSLSKFAYPVIKPIHVGWMTLGFALGWFNSRLLLGLFFYLVITPIGLVMRIMHKDILCQKIEPSKKSYWIKRERKPFDPTECERLY